MEIVTVTCPGCGRILLVDRASGGIVEVREPLVEKPSGDRFRDALEKTGRVTAEVQEKYSRSEQELRSRARELEERFKKSLEKAGTEPPEKKPPRPIDLD